MRAWTSILKILMLGALLGCSSVGGSSADGTVPGPTPVEMHGSNFPQNYANQPLDSGSAGLAKDPNDETYFLLLQKVEICRFSEGTKLRVSLEGIVFGGNLKGAQLDGQVVRLCDVTNSDQIQFIDKKTYGPKMKLENKDAPKISDGTFHFDTVVEPMQYNTFEDGNWAKKKPVLPLEIFWLKDASTAPPQPNLCSNQSLASSNLSLDPSVLEAIQDFPICKIQEINPDLLKFLTSEETQPNLKASKDVLIEKN